MGHRKVILAIVLSIAIMASAFTGLYLHHSFTEQGPAFNAQVFVTGDSVNAPFAELNTQNAYNGNVSVTIFSESPVYAFSHQDRVVNLTGYSASSDPYEMVLFNKTVPVSADLSGHLSTGFWNIAKQWQQYSQGHTGFVSLSLDATLTRTVNNTLYAYSFVNNVPYDPYGWNIPAMEAANSMSFSQNLYFNLSNPTYTVSQQNSTTAAVVHSFPPIGGGGGCTPCTGTGVRSVSTWTGTGPLPVMMAAFNGTNNQLLTYFMSQLNSSASVDINSITSVSGSATQTETASYGITGAVLGSSGAAEMSAPASMIYISNVTVQVYQYYYITIHVYSNCEIMETDSPVYTQISVIGTGQSPDLESASLGYVVNNYLSSNGKNTMSANTIDSAFLQLMSQTGTSSLAYSGSVAAGQSVLFSSITGSNTVYSNANAALMQAQSAVSLMTTAIGTELTIMDLEGAANGADGDITEPSLVATSISVGVTLAGDVGYVMSIMSSISYTVTVNEGITVGGFTNFPISSSSPMEITEYQSSNPVLLVVGGSNYYISFPSIVVNATLS